MSGARGFVILEFDSAEQFARHYEDWGVPDYATAKAELERVRIKAPARPIVVGFGEPPWEYALRLADDPEIIAGIRDGCIWTAPK